MKNPVDLLGIELRKFLLWHIIDKEVVANLRISVNTFTVSLCDSLREDSRVFRVE